MSIAVSGNAWIPIANTRRSKRRGTAAPHLGRFGSVADPRFWRGKSVLVTGHNGFKGGWLCAWLLEMGAKVHGYALAPDTTPSFYALTRLADRLDSTIADVRELEHLRSSIAAARPEIVFHLAAQPLVRRSYAQPLDTFAINVIGTANVLEA